MVKFYAKHIIRDDFIERKVSRTKNLYIYLPSLLWVGKSATKTTTRKIWKATFFSLCSVRIHTFFAVNAEVGEAVVKREGSNWALAEAQNRKLCRFDVFIKLSGKMLNEWDFCPQLGDFSLIFHFRRRRWEKVKIRKQKGDEKMFKIRVETPQ